MEKLRVEKKNIYTIEVNDNGDTIEFDLRDILGLNIKLTKALKRIDEIERNIKNELYILNKKPDVKGKYLSRNEEEFLKLWEKSFNEMRSAMDIFLGENACQKIFGDSNYIGMFDDLMEQLKPHLEKMKINLKSVAKQIEEKYSTTEKKVIE